MKKIYLTKKFQFSAAHRMHNSKLSDKENINSFGKCQNVHGHNYQIEISVSGPMNEATGYFVNLRELSEGINAYIVNVLDHQYLNEIIPDQKDRPVTMEITAGWIWETLNKNLPKYNFEKIRLWETPDNSVEIYKQD